MAKEEEIKRPKVGEGATSKADEEKTSEEKIKALEEQISKLSAQKEHFREKAQELREELEGLKKKEPTPSEEEIPDWDMLSPIEQRLLREQRGLRETISKLEDEIKNTKENLKREKEFSKAFEEFPELQEERREFKEFCEREENQGVPIEVLAKSFLFEAGKEEKLSRPGLEKSTGGERTQPPKMTLEDVRSLRRKNPRLYFQLIKEKKLKEIPEE